ncbi:MAG: WD40 repeat domain-containing protein [Pirellulaceae bacterium]
MSDVFDPYHEWLGIAPFEQPPHHYRLLGVRVFENDARVIDLAADRRMAQLRAAQIGRHAAQSQELLNAVAAARACLMHPQRRAEYDAELKRRFGEQPIHGAPAARVNAEQSIPSPRGAPRIGEAPLMSPVSPADDSLQLAPLDGASLSPSPSLSPLEPLPEVDPAALTPLQADDPLAADLPLDTGGAVLHDPLFGPTGYKAAGAPRRKVRTAQSAALRDVKLAALVVLAIVAVLMLMVLLAVMSLRRPSSGDRDDQQVASPPPGTTPVAESSRSYTTTEPGAAWLANPRMLPLSELDSSPTAIAVSPNGVELAVATGSRIYLYDLRRMSYSSVLSGGDGLGRPSVLAWPLGRSSYVFGTVDGRLRRGMFLTYVENESPITAMAMSPNGTQIAASGSNLHVLNTVMNQAVRGETSTPKLAGLVFSPDGKVIVGSDGRSQLHFFGDAADVAALDRARIGSPFLIDWSDLGGYEAYYDNNPSTLRIVDRDTRRVLLEQRSGGNLTPPPKIDFLPRSTTLAVFYYDKKIELLHNGQQLTPQGVVNLDHPCGLVSISADGDTLAVASGRSATVWDIKRNSPSASQKPFTLTNAPVASPPAPLARIATSPSASRPAASPPSPPSIATSARGWRAVELSGGTRASPQQHASAPGRPLKATKLPTLTGHTDSVARLDFSRDGALLASRTSRGQFHIWDVAKARQVDAFDISVSKRQMHDWSPVDDSLVYTERDALFRREPGGLREKLLDKQLGCVTYSADGSQILTADRSVFGLPSAGGPIETIDDRWGGWLAEIEPSPDGKVLALTNEVATNLRLLLSDGHHEPIETLAPHGGVQEAKWSNNGKYFAYATSRDVFVVSRKTGEDVAQFGIVSGGRNGSETNAFTLLHNGDTVATRGNRAVHFWDVETRLERLVLNTPWPVNALVVAPDGETLAVACGVEIHMWRIPATSSE